MIIPPFPLHPLEYETIIYGKTAVIIIMIIIIMVIIITALLTVII